MNWQFTPYALPPIISTVALLLLAVATWRSRSGASEKAFVALLGVLIIWLAGYTAELGLHDRSAVMFWVRVQYFGIVAMPVLWAVFVLTYLGRSEWGRLRIVALLFVVPVITLVMVWTSDYHSLHWSAVSLDASGPYLVFDAQYGPWFWIHTIYSYVVSLASTIALVWAIIQSSSLHRRQFILLFVAWLIPVASNAMYIAGLTLVESYDVTPIAFVISALLVGWTLYRYRLFDMVPLARSTVFENMNDGVIVTDDRNRIIDCNPAAQTLLKCSLPSAIGQPVDIVFAGLPALLERYQSDWSGNAELTLRSAHDSDTARYFDLNISPLLNRHGYATGRVAVLRDITEHKQVQAQQVALIREQERVEVLKRFIGHTSHDLRTPLSTIKVNVYLLKRLVESEQGQQYLSSMDIQVDHLTSVLESYLTMAQLDSTGINLPFGPVNVNTLLRDVVFAQEESAENRGLSLMFVPDTNLPIVLADKTNLERAFENLIKNAVCYTPAGGSIMVRTAFDESWVCVEFEDTGIGISADDLPHIFESFYRADDARSTDQGGAGLGLSIVKRIIDDHAGKIDVTSASGMGSLFKIMLPVPRRPESSG